jgi:hypothetical protein
MANNPLPTGIQIGVGYLTKTAESDTFPNFEEYQHP